MLYEWRILMETPGFKRLQQYAKDQVTRRHGDLHHPDCEHVDFIRGECAGISFFAAIPEIEKERLEEEVNTIAAREEQREPGDQEEELDDEDYLDAIGPSDFEP